MADQFVEDTLSFSIQLQSCINLSKILKPHFMQTAAFRAFGQLFGLVEQPMDHERLEPQHPSQ